MAKESWSLSIFFQFLVFGPVDGVLADAFLIVKTMGMTFATG